ncbi:hypothetical protein GDO81_024260 [Engystomops pustulosus]|nr:hypothetical protein GDO81_024260 [Engystomops pustulosus]
MTSLIGILCLLSALTATSVGLSCISCFSLDATSCTGDSLTCTSKNLCGSTYTENLVGGNITRSYNRGCLPSSECNLKGGISTNQGRIRSIISCCDTDNCSSSIPILPPFNNDLNGVVCPSCVSSNSTGCNPSETIKCKGDEKVCFTQTIKHGSTVITYIRGCTTRSVCDFASREGSPLEGEFVCMSGVSSLQQNLILLCSLILYYCTASIKW